MRIKEHSHESKFREFVFVLFCLIPVVVLILNRDYYVKLFVSTKRKYKLLSCLLELGSRPKNHFLRNTFRFN